MTARRAGSYRQYEARGSESRGWPTDPVLTKYLRPRTSAKSSGECRRTSPKPCCSKTVGTWVWPWKHSCVRWYVKLGSASTDSKT